MQLRAAHLAIYFLLALLAAPAWAESTPEAFQKDVTAFFARHCYDCHSGDEPEAGLAIDKLNRPETITHQRKSWTKILSAVRKREMPPSDVERPQEAEVAALTGWIERELVESIRGLKDPGRVTLRRLNRVEYVNTIRDLLEMDYEPAVDFPMDDTGYGFDTIGDVLTVSPLHMEKYMAAAREIAAQAIVTRDGLEGERLPDKLVTGSSSRSSLSLNSSGTLWAKYSFPRDGKYLFRVRAYGEQAGDEPVQMQFHFDDRDLQAIDVPAEAKEPDNYEIELDVKKGEHRLGVSFLNDFYDPDAPNRNQRDRNLRVVYFEVVSVSHALENLPQSHRKIIWKQPDPEQPLKTATELLRRFATQAYRRPATDDDVTRLVKLVKLVLDDGGTFEEGMQLAVQATLVSPQFLFRDERSPRPDDPTKIHPLGEYELASRLSYFLWSSMPDDELFRHAAQGTLRKNLDAQVKRMLADPKSRALAHNFGGQWLETRRLQVMTPDPKRFPGFDEGLRDAMRTETEMFFDAVVREDKSVLDFLNGRYTFLNETLARHYEIEGVRGDEFRRVALDGKQRSGVLTHGSVLTITSDPARTSPVMRGKWILEQILGETIPPPPPEAGELPEEGEELTGTLRQRLEQHRANPKCISCHVKMDPLGFALENYNAVGRWRTHEGKTEIDPSGELPDGRKISGPADLKQVLVERRAAFRRNLAEKMLTYALGRGLEYYDQPAIDAITKRMEAGGDRFSSLILGIVHSTPFQLRRGDGGTP